MLVLPIHGWNACVFSHSKKLAIVHGFVDIIQGLVNVSCTTTSYSTDGNVCMMYSSIRVCWGLSFPVSLERLVSWIPFSSVEDVVLIAQVRRHHLPRTTIMSPTLIWDGLLTFAYHMLSEHPSVSHRHGCVLAQFTATLAFCTYVTICKMVAAFNIMICILTFELANLC